MKKLLLYVFPSILAAVVLFLIFFFLYEVFFPIKTIEVFNQPFPILNTSKEISAGEIVQYQVIFHKYTAVYPTVYRNLICKSGVSFRGQIELSGSEKTPDNIETQSNISLSYVLPPNVKTNDNCYLQILSIYRINPFHQETLKFITESFTIK